MTFFRRKRDRADLVICYQSIFSTDQGKAVLYDLMKSCHVFDHSVTEDPHETAFNEGQRSVVLRIMKLMDVNPRQLRDMMKAGTEEEKREI